MPLVNYCRKCKAETPLGETCPYCGGKLSQTGRQISFGAVRVPVKDWFAWNSMLRVALPVLGLVFAAALLAEGASTGLMGVAALLKQGFFWRMMGLLVLVLALCWLILRLQGPEKVHYVLDKQGVHVRTYLVSPGPVQLYARMLTPQAAEALAAADDRPPLEGLTLVRRVTLPWTAVRRMRVWRECATLLFYHPRFWLAAAVRCPVEDFAQAEEMVCQKLKRVPGALPKAVKAKKRS